MGGASMVRRPCARALRAALARVARWGLVLGGVTALGGPLSLLAAGVPRVLAVGPLEGYGGLVAGVSEGLQASGYRDASEVRLEVRNIRSLDDAKAVVAAAVSDGVDVIVTVFGQATQAAHLGAPAVPVVFCPVADPV